MIFYSVHFNRPDFIEIQKKCIDEIGGTLVVIKNSNDSRIDEECKKFGIPCYISSSALGGFNSPSISHGHALNFLSAIIDYSQDWCILDHDFFPLKKIEFEDFEILGLIHGDHNVGNYLWPGFMAGKKEIKLDGINFLPSPGRDTGAGTSELLNRGYRIKEVPEEYLGFNPEGGYIQTQPSIVKFGDFGIHHLNGSEWMGVNEDVRIEKKRFLLETIENFKNITI
jgi:hypothetical protein